MGIITIEKREEIRTDHVVEKIVEVPQIVHEEGDTIHMQMQAPTTRRVENPEVLHEQHIGEDHPTVMAPPQVMSAPPTMMMAAPPTMMMAAPPTMMMAAQPTI